MLSRLGNSSISVWKSHPSCKNDSKLKAINLDVLVKHEKTQFEIQCLHFESYHNVKYLVDKKKIVLIYENAKLWFNQKTSMILLFNVMLYI